MVAPLPEHFPCVSTLPLPPPFCTPVKYEDPMEMEVSPESTEDIYLIESNSSNVAKTPAPLIEPTAAHTTLPPIVLPVPEEMSVQSVDISTRMSDIVEKIAAQSSRSLLREEHAVVDIAEGFVVAEGIPHTGSCDVNLSMSPREETSSRLPGLLKEVQQKLQGKVPRFWVMVWEEDGVCVGSRAFRKTLLIQRSVFVRANGQFEISVHGKELPKAHPFWSKVISVTLTENTIDDFASNLCKLLNLFRQWEVCKGVEEFQPSWHSVEGTEIDNNSFLEPRLTQSCRSKKCLRIVEGLKTKRCPPCQEIWTILYRRQKANEKYALPKDTPPSKKPDAYLNTPELLKRLNSQRREIRRTHDEIERIRRQMDALLQQENVEVDEGLHEDLHTILTDTTKTEKLTEMQRLFVEQQLKAASVASATAMRWHPAIIRLALSLKMTSSAAYEVLRGVLRLPSERQLFDYSHAIEAKDEIHPDMLGDLVKEVDEKFPKPFQRQFLLVNDEIYVKQNLVYNKFTGEMTGYVKLHEVDLEIRAIEQMMDDESLNKSVPTSQDPPVVTKMLTYMAVGVCNGLRSVVACYGVNKLTAEMLDRTTWEVTGALEVNGLQVVGFVSDGAGPNTAFYQMQKPMYSTDSGTVFCTPNRFDPDRPVFLISDPPHLLKTTRNCLYNSGRKRKKGKGYVRYMKKNGQSITWDTVLRLYNKEKTNTVREVYKLTQAAVELNSYSVMNVSLAARVLSRSVASAVRLNNWTECEEFAIFAENFNDLFDMLNGAYTFEHMATRNDLLAPYKKTDDFRFKKMLEIWEYLEQWSKEVANSDLPPADKLRSILSPQTLQGWEHTIKGFIGAVKYILEMAEKSGDTDVFILARRFCQDALEHYFGKQRSRLGGNVHPDFHEALRTNRQLHVQRTLGLHGPKSGNAGRNRSDIRVKDLDSKLKVRAKKVRRTL